MTGNTYMVRATALALFRQVAPLHSEIQTSLSSIEEFNQFVGETGWATDFRQLDRTASPLEFAAQMAPDIALLRVNFRNGVHQLGATPPGAKTFGIPTGPQADIQWGSGVIPSESITHFDGTMDTVTAPGFSAFTISLTDEAFSESVTKLGLSGDGSDSAGPGTASLPSGSGSRSPAPTALARLRAQLEAGFQLLAGPIPNKPLVENFQRQLPAAFLPVWQGASAEKAPTFNHHWRTISRALDYLHGTGLKDCRLEDVCAAAACSQRTLERLFNRRFGLPPKRYIDGLRLSQARSDLLNPSDHRSVGDVAADAGFWHLSLFAGNYRQRYGELPSETRRRKLRL